MQKLASKFGIGGSSVTSKDYVGPVLLTHDAIYIVAAWAVLAAEVGGLAGGLVGFALGAAIDKAQAKRIKEPAWEPISALPPDVARHPGMRGVKSEHKFLRLAKEDVQSLRFSQLSGVKIAARDVTINLPLMLWQVGKARTAFVNHGWPQARK